ncbi:MAG: P-II family nitrogen regulator [Clostridia bacterium]
MYVMFAVISDTKKVKQIINKLRDIGIKGATIVDTMGGGSHCEARYLSSRPAIGSMYRPMNDPGFSKTIISVIYCEQHVLAAMDAIEEILGGNMKMPHSGIIFTLPVEDCRGGELHRCLSNEEYL